MSDNIIELSSDSSQPISPLFIDPLSSPTIAQCSFNEEKTLDKPGDLMLPEGEMYAERISSPTCHELSDSDEDVLSNKSSCNTDTSECYEFKELTPDDGLKISDVHLRSTLHELSESDDDKNDINNEFPNDSVFENLPRFSLEERDTFDCESESTIEIDSQTGSPKKKKTRRKLTQEEKDQEQELKQKAREERARLKEMRTKNKELKNMEKEKRQHGALQFRKIRPAQCMQFIKMIVDQRLYNTVLFTQAMELFPSPEVKIISRDLPFENTIVWSRTEENGLDKEENVLAIMWDADKIADKIKSNSLIETFKKILECYPGKSIVLWIFTLNLYYRKSKSAYYKSLKEGSQEPSSKKPSRCKDYVSSDNMEKELTKLQILCGISFRSFETQADFCNLLHQFTKSIAETPFRLEREKLVERFSWYNRGESKNCVKIDKDMNGLSRLWTHFFLQFHNSNLDVANTITSYYPTPQDLIKAYNKCTCEQEKEDLLKDIQVRRTTSSSAAARKIGPEMSRRVCLMFSQRNGELQLSQQST